MPKPELTEIHPRSSLRGVSRHAKRKYQQVSVPTALASEAQENGWTPVRTTKRKTILRQEKEVSQMLEDRVWNLLYTLEFPWLSLGNKSELYYDSDSENETRNQIDAVAIDDLICIVVECKSRQDVGRSSALTAAITKFSSLRSRIQSATRRAIGESKGRPLCQIIWTDRIIVTGAQQDRAKADNILLLDENDLDYYEKLAGRIGAAARYQLLADLMPGRQIGHASFTVPAIRTKVLGRWSYTFAASPEQLLPIAYFAHKAKGRSGSDAYQRMVTKARLRSIKRYIQDNNFFPTNILLSVNNSRRLNFMLTDKKVRSESSLGILEVKGSLGLAWIIDGQHRLLAYAGLPEAAEHRLMVTAFDELPAYIQAKLFKDINHEQKSVSQALLLLIRAEIELSSERDVDKVHAIATMVIKGLDSNPDCPFYGRIVWPDQTRTEDRCITLASFEDALVRPGTFARKEHAGKITSPGAFWDPDVDKCIARTDEIIRWWFQQIVDENVEWWSLGSRPGGGFAMNNGVIIVANVLRSSLAFLEESKGYHLSELDTTEVLSLLRPLAIACGLGLSTLTTDERSFVRSLRGVGDQYRYGTRRVQLLMREECPMFNPEGLDEFVEKMESEANSIARDLIDNIERRLKRVVIADLKSRLLEEEEPERWWLLGVPRGVRKKADDRFNENDGKRGSREAYLDLIDYRSIICYPENWDHFKSRFAEPGAGGKEKSTKWLVELNEVRRVTSHPTSEVVVSDDQLSQLRKIRDRVFAI